MKYDRISGFFLMNKSKVTTFVHLLANKLAHIVNSYKSVSMFMFASFTKSNSVISDSSYTLGIYLQAAGQVGQRQQPVAQGLFALCYVA